MLVYGKTTNYSAHKPSRKEKASIFLMCARWYARLSRQPRPQSRRHPIPAERENEVSLDKSNASMIARRERVRDMRDPGPSENQARVTRVLGTRL